MAVSPADTYDSNGVSHLARFRDASRDDSSSIDPLLSFPSVPPIVHSGSARIDDPLAQLKLQAQLALLEQLRDGNNRPYTTIEKKARIELWKWKRTRPSAHQTKTSKCEWRKHYAEDRIRVRGRFVSREMERQLKSSILSVPPLSTV